MSTKPFVLLVGAIVALGAGCIAEAQESRRSSAPRPEPEPIICSVKIAACGCMGSEDCEILKKFAGAGGCSDLKCTGEVPDVCTCQISKSAADDSPLLTAARRHGLLEPSTTDLAAGPKVTRDCKAVASCGNTKISCSVKGAGACQGADNDKVSCTEFFSDGSSKTTTTNC